MQASQINLGNIASLLAAFDNPETRENGPNTPVRTALTIKLAVLPKGEVLRCVKRMMELASSRHMVEAGMTTPRQARQIRRNTKMNRTRWKRVARSVQDWND